MPGRIGTHTWDTLHASKLDLLRGKKNGKLLRYDPKTEKVDILAEGIWFANGVAVDKDETFVIISETFSSRALKYNSKDGSVEVMADRFPGYPDGADCSHKTGSCYIPMPSSEPGIVKFLKKLPNYFDLIPRALVMILPKSLSPKPVKYGGIVEIIPGHKSQPSGIKRLIQDPRGDYFSMLTGVSEYKGKLYLGSLTNDFIGVFDLSK